MFDFNETNSKTNDDKVVITVLFFALFVMLIEIILLFYISMNLTNCLLF